MTIKTIVASMPLITSSATTAIAMPHMATTHSSLPISNTTSQTTISTSTTSTTSPSCSLTSLPKSFFIKDSPDSYLSVNYTANPSSGFEVIDVSTTAVATVFHINSTYDGPSCCLDQLSFNHNDSITNTTIEYSAWARNGGSPITFFSGTAEGTLSGAYESVIATFSTYLCQLTLRAWLDHDLSVPEKCDGVLYLENGGVETCEVVNLTVEPAL